MSTVPVSSSSSSSLILACFFGIYMYCVAYTEDGGPHLTTAVATATAIPAVAVAVPTATTSSTSLHAVDPAEENDPTSLHTIELSSGHNDNATHHTNEVYAYEDNVPAGKWRRGFYDCFEACCCPCILVVFCPFILMGQIMQRMNMNYFGYVLCLHSSCLPSCLPLAIVAAPRKYIYIYIYIYILYIYHGITQSKNYTLFFLLLHLIVLVPSESCPNEGTGRPPICLTFTIIAITWAIAEILAFIITRATYNRGFSIFVQIFLVTTALFLFMYVPFTVPSRQFNS